MTISVVIATWNGLHLLRPCVQALLAQTLPHELVIVDNGSLDDTAIWARQAVPAAKVIPLPHNLGFAGGNNVGMRAARGDLLVLLNNDTLPEPDFLAEITRPLGSLSDVGSVAGVLTFARRPETVASAGIVAGRDGVHRDARMLTPVAALPNTLEEVFGPSGGAVCFRRSALEEVGLFEERFFNYLEDADLAWRLRLRQWRCVLAPAARASHIYSASAGHASPFKRRLLALNRWRVLLRCMPSRLLRRCLWPILRYDLLAVVYGCATRQMEIVAGRLQALREMPVLLRERRRIAGRAITQVDTLAQWLVPALTLRQILQEGRELDRVLRERP